MKHLFILYYISFLMICSCGERKIADEQLRVAIHPWPGYSFIYLAKELGFFRDAGLDIKVLELGSLGDARRVFEKKQVDVMPCTNIDFLEARNRGCPDAQIFYMLDFSDGGDVIIADPSIQSLEELKGKRIAVEENSITVFLLYRAFQKEGLEIKDVQLVKMDQTLMESAYEDKRVDAIISFPPFSNRMKKEHGMKVIFSSADIPNEILDFLVADKDYIETHQEMLVKFIRAHERALLYAKSNQDEACAIMAKHLEMSGPCVSDALKHEISMIGLHDQKNYFGRAGQATETMKVTEAFLLKEGLINKCSTFPYINESILNEVLMTK